MDSEEHDEGWYTDPYGRHEARWMSMGRPTKLVRDGDVESYEDPPDAPPTQQPERIEPPEGSINSSDTVRADDAESRVPTMAEIDDAERNLALSGWKGPLTRSKRASKHKSDSKFFK